MKSDDVSPVLKYYGRHNFQEIEQIRRLSPEVLNDIEIVSRVLPFRVNSHTVAHLIDWEKVPDDPIFKIVFPQKQMLPKDDFEHLTMLVSQNCSKEVLDLEIDLIRKKLNPHPGDQMTLNVPVWQEKQLKGMQHKYDETLLFFPTQGQYCHSYCTFCFRWAQFIGNKTLMFNSTEVETLCNYLRSHPKITDVLFTGGDPMVMKASHWKEYLLPLLKDPGLNHIQTIRIGTKALTYWPYRFLSDPDTEDLLEILKEVVRSGKHLAIMAHFSHWKELEQADTEKAIRRLQEIGAVIRSQGVALTHVNDDAEIWVRLWNAQVQLGIVPYYMFVERDTGANSYFEIPLEKAFEVYSEAISRVSGLAKTVRGPVMSASPGKILIEGVQVVGGQKVFALKFLQARSKKWLNQLFFAEYSSKATWFSHLKPAFQEPRFFFESETNFSNDTQYSKMKDLQLTEVSP